MRSHYGHQCGRRESTETHLNFPQANLHGPFAPLLSARVRRVYGGPNGAVRTGGAQAAQEGCEINGDDATAGYVGWPD